MAVKATERARQANRDNASKYTQSLFNEEEGAFKNIEASLGESAQKTMISNLDAIST
jgi:hypothetical protein